MSISTKDAETSATYACQILAWGVTVGFGSDSVTQPHRESAATITEKSLMPSPFSDTESEAVSAIILVAFCSSMTWIEEIQSMLVTFPNGREERLFLGDKRPIRRLIEQAASLRGLPITVY